VEAAAIVPMAMAGGTKDATAPAMSAPIACQSIMSFMGKAQDLALDRVASVPDQAILQRLQRRVACRGTEVEGDSDRRSTGSGMYAFASPSLTKAHSVPFRSQLGRSWQKKPPCLNPAARRLRTAAVSIVSHGRVQGCLVRIM